MVDARVWPEVDVRYTVTATGLKEDFVVRSAAGFDTPGVFVVESSRGAMVRPDPAVRSRWCGTGTGTASPRGTATRTARRCVCRSRRSLAAKGSVLSELKPVLLADVGAERARAAQRRVHALAVAVDAGAAERLASAVPGGGGSDGGDHSPRRWVVRGRVQPGGQHLDRVEPVGPVGGLAVVRADGLLAVQHLDGLPVPVDGRRTSGGRGEHQVADDVAADIGCADLRCPCGWFPDVVRTTCWSAGVSVGVELRGCVPGVGRDRSAVIRTTTGSAWSSSVLGPHDSSTYVNVSEMLRPWVEPEPIWRVRSVGGG